MSEVTLNFSREEYAERLAKTRAAMARAGIELLIVSDPSNMAWLTGYDGWSFYVHQCVLVPPDGDPIWYGRGQDAAGVIGAANAGVVDFGHQVAFAQSRLDLVGDARVHLLDDARRGAHILKLPLGLHRPPPVDQAGGVPKARPRQMPDQGGMGGG